MARSRARSDDQKQVLTISLVLFVLLSIVLAGVAYLGYSGQSDLEEKLKTANAQAAALRKERNQYEVQTLTYKLLTGYDDKGDEQKLDGLKKEYKEVFEGVTGKHKTIAWNPAEKLPTRTYSSHIAELEKKLMEAAKGRVNCEEQNGKMRVIYEKDLAAMRDANKKVEEALTDTKKLIDEKFTNIDKKYNEAIDALVKALPANEENVLKIRTLEKEKAEVTAKLNKTLADAQTRIQKLEEKIPQIDLLAYDQPKGKILTIDRTGSTAYLNLGTVDYVKPGMTFSIFGVGQYKPNAERKASVEVVSVSGDHMCMARVTETRAGTRDPILTGDLLYNPAWTPGLREHVAIAGFIDLSGDGRDETAEFVRALEKQGVVVDSYLDLKDLTYKGALKANNEHVNRQTSYLILGDLPDLDKQMATNVADPRLEKKMNINEEIGKLRDKAVSLGVTVVPARKFMALAGMKVPKQMGNNDWTTYTLKKGGDPAADKKDEMKKDDMKKDDKKEEKKEDKDK